MTMARINSTLLTVTTLCAGLMAATAWAQKYPITPGQEATAQKVAQAGVPLADLAPNAPDTYVVKAGDTLWDISKLFLQSPWRWPELWGMNLDDIKNPHLIYPGQTLVLDKANGRATLRTANAKEAGTGDNAGPSGLTVTLVDEPDVPTVKLSPRTRLSHLKSALSTLKPGDIDPFLNEPLIVDDAELASAARIVAAPDKGILLTRGDRAYARGPLATLDPDAPNPLYRIFNNATPLKDPDTGKVLGFEAHYAGKARLVRNEASEEAKNARGKSSTAIVPATIDIVEAKDEILVGYRLLPDPAREFPTFTPHAPATNVSGKVVSVYGSAVVNASQNQVVVLNLGRLDGIERGHVLAILKDGKRMVDTTDPQRAMIKLPNERNGLLMVFRTFDHLSYGLILEITDAVRVGDRLIQP